MVWIYSFFVSIFGTAALTAVRILTIIYLYLSVLYFQGMVVEYRVFKRTQFAPSIFLILLCCTPWHGLQLSAPLLMIYPLIFSFHSIIRLSMSQTGNYRRLFLAGFLLFAGILADYHALGFLVGVCLAYFTISQAKIDEFFGILLGVFGGLLLFVLFLYFNGIGKEFWEIGFSSFFYNWLNGGADIIRSARNSTLISMGLNWGIMIIIGILGLIHFRLKILNYVILIRKVELAMLLWLLSGIAILLFSGLKLQFSDLLTITPPLAFYAAKTWDLRMIPAVRSSLIALLIVAPLFMGLHFVATHIGRNIGPMTTEEVDELLGIKSILPIHEAALSTYFQEKSFPNGIWVLDNRPELYPYLGAKAVNKYIDFSLSVQKISYFGHESGLKKASDEDIFLQFQQQKPDYIIDVTGGFAKLRKRFPSLLGSYEVEAVGHYSVWKEREDN